MGTANITHNRNGFKTLSYSLTALPILPFLKLTGFSSDGVTWEDNEPASVRLGADGLTAVNQKPVLYVGTFSLLPNSGARNVLDVLIAASTPVFGKKLTGYDLILTELNEMTGYSTVYSGGVITSCASGNSATLDDGQQDKTYQMTFSTRILMPV